MPMDFDFKKLQRKLIHKLDIVEENLEITYLYHTESEARRVSITDDDDLDAFKFLNNKSNKSEWDIELYITSAPKSPNVVSSNQCYLGPPTPMEKFSFHRTQSKRDHTPSTPGEGPSSPNVEESFDDIISLDFLENVDVTNFQKEGRRIGYSLDETIESDEDDDFLFREVLKKRKMDAADEVISISSDEEEVAIEQDPQGQVLLGEEEEEQCIFGLDDIWNEINGIPIDEIGVMNDPENIDNVDVEVITKIQDWYYPAEDVRKADVVRELKIGQMFETKEELKAAVAELALKNYFETRTLKSCKVNYLVRCKEKDCTFLCQASVLNKTGLFEIKKYEPNHTCGMRSHHKREKVATSKFIARKILHQ